MSTYLRIIAFLSIMIGLAPSTVSAQHAMHSLEAAPPADIRLIADQPMAPEIAFKDQTGRDWGFVEFQGRVVVAMFWATWCPICFGEMPKLNRLQANFDENELLVVALSQDHDGAEKIKRYYTERNLDNLKIFLDPGSIMASALAIRGVPTAFVIDPSGKLVGVGEGSTDWNSPEVDRFLRDFLPERGLGPSASFN